MQLLSALVGNNFCQGKILVSALAKLVLGGGKGGKQLHLLEAFGTDEV